MPLFGPPNIEELAKRKDIAGLQKAEKHKDPQISEAATHALIILRAPQDIQDKIAETRSKDSTVRVAAVKSLGYKGDPAAVNTLLKLTEDPDLVVRQMVIWALAFMRFVGRPPERGDLFVTHLTDPDDTIRENAAFGLTKIVLKDSAKEPLLQALKGSPRVRAHAAQALANSYAEELLDTIIKELLADPDKDVRWKTANGLGDYAKRTGSQKAILALFDIFKDENTTVRMSAAQSLGDIGAGQYKPDDPFWKDFADRLGKLKANERSSEVAGLLNGAIVRTLKLQGYR